MKICDLYIHKGILQTYKFDRFDKGEYQYITINETSMDKECEGTGETYETPCGSGVFDLDGSYLWIECKVNDAIDLEVCDGIVGSMGSVAEIRAGKKITLAAAEAPCQT